MKPFNPIWQCSNPHPKVLQAIGADLISVKLASAGEKSRRCIGWSGGRCLGRGLSPGEQPAGGMYYEAVINHWLT
jgi:hypothetical protein